MGTELLALSLVIRLLGPAEAEESSSRRSDPVGVAHRLFEELKLAERGLELGFGPEPVRPTVRVLFSVRGRSLLEDAWMRAFEGAVVDHLEALGVRRPARLGAEEVASRERRRAQALAAGGDWLLDLVFRPAASPSADGLDLQASLIQVDRGLWRPLPAPAPVRATALVQLGPSLPKTDLVQGPSSRLLVLGRPTPLAEWTRAVWGLGLCTAEARYGRLIVVEADRVTVLDLGPRGLRPLTAAPLPLTGHARARAALRPPWALVRCGAQGAVGVGHGRLERGIVISGVTGQLQGELPGHPVGFDRAWWTAQPVAGELRYEVIRQGPKRVPLEAGTRSLHFDANGGWAVDESGQLRPLTATGAFGLARGEVGRGLAVFEVPGSGLRVVASTSPTGEESLVVFAGRMRAERRLPGQAQALALGFRPPNQLVAVVALSREGSGSLVLVPIEVRQP